MNIKVKIDNFKTVNELADYWTEEDFRALLEEFEFPDVAQVDSSEVKDMLYMAMTDFEPDEAAKVILTQKLKEKLSEGQIQNLSHEMIEDKVAEEYPEPALHYDLFNINQLLYHAFNGVFPKTEATFIKLNMDRVDGAMPPITTEILLKAIQPGLKETSLIMRLYDDQLLGKEKFGDAEKVIWRFSKTSENAYEVLTSDYFFEDEDFAEMEYMARIKFFEE